MNYPPKFYIYGDPSIESAILDLLEEYGVEYSVLPNPGNEAFLKYRCRMKGAGRINSLDAAVENLGGWLAWKRMAIIESEETGDWTGIMVEITKGTTPEPVYYFDTIPEISVEIVIT